MNILGAIRREERKLRKQAVKLQRQLEGLKAAAKALVNSAGNEVGKPRKRSEGPGRIRINWNCCNSELR